MDEELRELEKTREKGWLNRNEYINDTVKGGKRSEITKKGKYKQTRKDEGGEGVSEVTKDILYFQPSGL